MSELQDGPVIWINTTAGRVEMRDCVIYGSSDFVNSESLEETNWLIANRFYHIDPPEETDA